MLTELPQQHCGSVPRPAWKLPGARDGRNVLRRRAPGWRVTLLSPDAALERQLQIPMHVVARTANGGIPVRIVSGEVPIVERERG